VTRSQRLAMSGISHPGRVRGENEDSFVTQPEIGVAVLADGMGGHQAGEVASRMAVDLIAAELAAVPATATLPDGSAIVAAVRKANAAIHRAAETHPAYQGMGSTVVVALFHHDHLHIGHVGDSRVYLLRNHRLTQLTKDHSVVQELVNRGLFTPEEARQSLAKNLVTRALGTEAVIEPELTDTVVEHGDIYLLCSDGLTDVVSDAQISEIVTAAAGDMDVAARRLVDKANEHGGPDNISVVLVHVVN
jgi:serine/threonine protein phosphatase PrpC